MKRGKYLKTCGILVFFLSTTFTSSAARIIYVDDNEPTDFNNIQAAINDANDGDTIIVADGIYTGDGNRDIDFLGKAITLRSKNGPQNCIIDCQGSEADKHRGFHFYSGEDANSVLDGFTVTNGYRGSGGAISCSTSSPHITNCIITNNVAPISGNLAGDGAGIATYSGSPIIDNCIISGNTATGSGGGFFCFKGSPAINNCTISYNSAPGDGGGIVCYADCVVIVSNCIFWGNTAVLGPQISLIEVDLLGGCPTFTISYSDIQGGTDQIYTGPCWKYLTLGPGNINADPCFADTSSCNPNEWDHHLKSQAGRWEPSTQVWVQDEVTSPCIDAGDPGSPIGDELFPNGGRVNMGAYGGTAEASKSYFGRPVCEIIVAGDLNGDCIVNYLDFRLMAAHWLRDENQ